MQGELHVYRRVYTSYKPCVPWRGGVGVGREEWEGQKLGVRGGARGERE